MLNIIKYWLKEASMFQTKLQALPRPSHYWKPCDLALSPYVSLFELLKLSQSSTVEQNVRLRSGKCQYVLASRLNFEAAQHPALNQRASLCSALTKMYPEQQKKHVQKQNQQQCPGLQSCTQGPSGGAARIGGHK